MRQPSRVCRSELQRATVNTIERRRTRRRRKGQLRTRREVEESAVEQSYAAATGDCEDL